MKNLKSYILVVGLLTSTIVFSFLGDYWNRNFYGDSLVYDTDNMPLIHAMNGIHDGLLSDTIVNFTEDAYYYLAASELEPWGLFSVNTVTSYSKQIFTDRANALLTDSLVNPKSGSFAPLQLPMICAVPFELTNKENVIPKDAQDSISIASDLVTLDSNSLVATAKQLPASEQITEPICYTFSTTTEDYFEDAVFIGDSRTVGICEYSGIENATFLCKTSLSIFDYEKKKITYENKKTSIKEVLAQKQFGKIYIMLGINECRYSTFDEYMEAYSAVITDIRALQPQALIFIESSLLVTTQKSKEDSAISNEKLQKRNDAIATLANQQDTFFIDINESSLCKDGALIAEYTWDHIHIKAQYYSLWKDYLLSHAIIKS